MNNEMYGMLFIGVITIGLMIIIWILYLILSFLNGLGQENGNDPHMDGRNYESWRN